MPGSGYSYQAGWRQPERQAKPGSLPPVHRFFRADISPELPAYFSSNKRQHRSSGLPTTKYKYQNHSKAGRRREEEVKRKCRQKSLGPEMQTISGASFRRPLPAAPGLHAGIDRRKTLRFTPALRSQNRPGSPDLGIIPSLKA